MEKIKYISILQGVVFTWQIIWQHLRSCYKLRFHTYCKTLFSLHVDFANFLRRKFTAFSFRIFSRCWYSVQIKLWVNSRNLRVFSRFYPNRENLMHAKYRCFTVDCSDHLIVVLFSATNVYECGDSNLIEVSLCEGTQHCEVKWWSGRSCYVLLPVAGRRSPCCRQWHHIMQSYWYW